MSIHRAFRALLASLIASTACVVPWAGPAAIAQEDTVTLTLVSQTPITTQREPLLRLTVQATNTGDAPLEGLSLGIAIGPQIASRFVYERSITDGPGSTLICCASRPQEGPLEPGQQRRFDVRLNMAKGIPEIAAAALTDALDSAVYPARIELRSDDVVRAFVDTALIHLARAPERPMLLASWTEVGGPIAFGPDGRLEDRSLEASVAPGGVLAAQAQALRERTSVPELLGPTDIVIQPSLLDQLTRMQDGYERRDGSTVEADQPPATHAASVLRALREVAAVDRVRISAQPFSAPLLPAMLHGGLATDLEEQREVGARTVATVLGADPTTAFDRPPAGAIDDDALEDLAARGVGAVLANTDAVERAVQLNDFAPLPTITYALGSGSSVELVLPDPSVQTLLADPDLLADPVRAAQVVLGELATIWREQPMPAPQPDGTPTVRGVAVALTSSLPPTIWGPISRRLAGASFLDPMHPQRFAASVHPTQDASVLASPSSVRFERDYVQKLRDERRDVEAYRSMLLEPTPVPDRLRRDLFYAEAGVYVGDELAGRRWIDQVNAYTDRVFERVLPAEVQAFTLTSDEGEIPFRMGDPGSVPLTIQIQLRSSRFDFPDGSERTVTLREPDQIVTFTVRAKTSGTQTIRMRTRAPSGRPLDERNLAVRTTTVNTIALAITGAAGLVLIALWSRRYVRRPRS